jgi:hypothetical protein
MKISRPSRVVAAFIALISMLFMQFAVASYACPGMSMGAGNVNMTAMSVGVDSSGMLNCDGMDKNQPSLCHAHAQDQQSKQSLDKPQSPDVQPFTAIGLVLAVFTIDFAADTLPTQPESLLLARSNAPPIAILHCCFRI